MSATTQLRPFKAPAVTAPYSVWADRSFANVRASYFQIGWYSPKNGSTA
jgi:hypothetical protein